MTIFSHNFATKGIKPHPLCRNVIDNSQGMCLLTRLPQRQYIQAIIWWDSHPAWFCYIYGIRNSWDEVGQIVATWKSIGTYQPFQVLWSNQNVLHVPLTSTPTNRPQIKTPHQFRFTQILGRLFGSVRASCIFPNLVILHFTQSICSSITKNLRLHLFF